MTTNLRQIRYDEYIKYCKDNDIMNFFTYKEYVKIVNVQLWDGERKGTITNGKELLKEYPDIQEILRLYMNRH